MRKFIPTLRRFGRDERGVTLVEYGIAIALAVVLGTGALATLGGNIGTAMTRAGGCMPPAAGALPATC